MPMDPWRGISRKRRHVKPGLGVAVAICATDRTCVTRQATAVHAHPASLRRFQMRSAVACSKSIGRKSLHRTGTQAGPVFATVARMMRPGDAPAFSARQIRKSRRLCRLCAKQDRAAISVPQPVFRMYQQSQRRRMETLRSHRPSLERLPRLVRRKHRFARQPRGNRPDDMPGPGIERIRHVGMQLSPEIEDRPESPSGVTDQANQSGRLATGKDRRVVDLRS